MIAPTWGELMGYRQRLMLSYIHYCTTVSKRSMAISIETASAFWAVCAHQQAKTVADLGSGFTSFVARLYAADAEYPVDVYSVDDDEYWLDKTRVFLEEHLIDSHGLVLAEYWRNSTAMCDVIIHDIASGPVREEWMTVAAEHLAPGGVIICDDMHHDGHRSEAHAVADKFGFEVVDIGDATRDAQNRYALMLVAP